MAELKNSGLGAYRGHPIEGITIERELYWLAVAFAGSRALYDLTPDEEKHEFDSLRLHFETSEVSRLLVSVAVMLRNSIDANPEQVEYRVKKPDLVVGYYFIGGQRKKKELMFCEACHKVIHALHVNFDLAGMKKKKKLGYLRPVVHLYGEFRGSEWRAVLNAMKFITIAYRLS